MYATYLVPSENSPRLEKKLAALAKKARKLGCAAILYTLVKTFSRPHHNAELAAEGKVEVFDAWTVRGEAPTLEGWTFAATLEHHTLPDGRAVNILRSHSEDTLPERFRTATPDHCDHCHTVRQRSATFVVHNESTGEWAQVGRQCLKDFLGLNADPGAVARYAALLLTLEVMFREEGDSYGYSVPTYDVRSFLAFTAQSINDKGWLSRTKARELSEQGPGEVMATADRVVAFLEAKTIQDRAKYDIPKPTEKTFEEVDAALAWTMEQDAGRSDYIHNCQVIIELGAVTGTMAGYAASIVSSYRRAMQRETERQLLKAEGTKHVGTIGKREVFKVTLLSVTALDSDWGVSFLHRFMDSDGNLLVWFGSNPNVVPGPAAGHRQPPIAHLSVAMEEKASYLIKATVKAHDHYKGQAQTKITRVAVQPLTKPPRKRKARKAKAVEAA